MSLSQCHVMVVLFFANVMAPGPALGVNCKYFGTELGTVGDFVVKDTCPPPQNNEVYYFTVDIDSGSSGSVVMQATLLSPADTACDGATCNSNALPGYDVYVSDNCLPLPNAPGMSISGTSPNDSNANKKELSFTAKSFTRFYLGLSKKSSIAAGNPSCSFKLFPGAADGAFDCSIADYKESLGIQPCNPPISSIDIRIVLAAAGCGIGASALVFLCCWWRDRKRRTGKMLSDAEEELAETIAATSREREHAIKTAPIDIEAARSARKAGGGPGKVHPMPAGASPGADAGLMSLQPKQDAAAKRPPKLVVEGLDAGWNVHSTTNKT